MIADRQEPMAKKPPSKGDYVVATKYADGDPGDQFCVGWYDGSYDHHGQTRHLVIDEKGQKFRANGFRRVQRIASARGSWMVLNLKHIESMRDRFSVWHWARAPWKELRKISGETA